MSLAQNIKKRRLEMGMTQEQLAAILNVSAQAVSKWETSDTYPDGNLLTALSSALNVSLDVLFDNNIATMEDVSWRLMEMIKHTKASDRIKVVREACWQIQKGLFMREMDEPKASYSPLEINKLHYRSYYNANEGFTYVSNEESPFFMVFADEDGSFAEAIGDGEKMRLFFELLGDKDTMNAMMYLHRMDQRYVFEADVLAQACEISADKIQTVMDNLVKLYAVYKREVVIDGVKCNVYQSLASYTFIALMLVAQSLDYNGVFNNRSNGRSTPYLK